jgi:hypothetical protein
MKTQKIKKTLQTLSVIVLFINICPYLYMLFNISPVYLFQQQTGDNALLQIYIPACLIGILGSVSFLLLVTSLFFKDKSAEQEVSD